MARKTRRDRDLERQQASTVPELTVEISIGPVDAMRNLHPELDWSSVRVASLAVPLTLPLPHAASTHVQTRSQTRLTAQAAQHARTLPALTEPIVLHPPQHPPAARQRNVEPIPLLPPDDLPSTSADDGQTINGQDGGASSGSSESFLDKVAANEVADNAHKDQPCLAGESWEKVLWKEQPVPDNYVHDTFLKDLVVNAQVPVRRYWPVVLDAAAVSQQLSLATAAGLAPMHLLLGGLTATQLLVISALLLVFGYLTCALLGGHLLGGSLGRGLRQGLLLVGGVYFLSPLLKTLAATVSPDSVIAVSVGALVVHLFLHDYSFVNSGTDKLSGTVSLAAAALAAVTVASMMPSELHVFAQVLFALELFLLFPYVRRYLRATSTTAHIITTLLLVVATTAPLALLSPGFAAAYMVLHVTLTLLCPWALVSIHKYKAKISGPWDEAVPHIPVELRMDQVPAAKQ